ncbi:MAG: hypothetical protein ACJ72N_11795 [Labedaea sp.]
MVSDRAAAVRSARATWQAATRDGAAACGLDVAGQAYEAMRAAWFAELGVHLAILERSDVDH